MFKLIKKIFYSIVTILMIEMSPRVFSCSIEETETNVNPNAINKETVIEKNKNKFSALKKYNLPIGQYAIGGSGPLGIRGIREIQDIDIIVSNELRDILIKKYGMVDDGKVKKIVFPNDDIEAFWEGSFYTQKEDKNAPTISTIILRADIINGLPFESLKDTIYFKRKMNRPKDLEDIRLIEEWKKNTGVKS